MTLKRLKRGFTMVELLVVIAILAVLAALVFAGASKAMKAARGVECVNNLRQCGIVLMQIKEEGIENGWNGPGFFPGYAGQINGPTVSWRKYNIHQLIGEKAGFCEFGRRGYSWSVHPSETFLQNPMSANVLCEGIGVRSISSENYDEMGGFAYNSLIEGWTAPHTPEEKVKMTNGFSIDNPALLIVMGEQNPAIETSGMWLGPWGDRIPAGTGTDRVRCLMADAHVEVFQNDYLKSEEGKAKHFNPRNQVF